MCGQAGVWSRDECQASLTINGLYEACGNALWLRTGVYNPQPGDNINWSSLESFAENFFAKRTAFKATVTRTSNTGTKKQKGERQRLLWPANMICIVENIKDALQESPDCGLPLLGTGQFVLWAWYLSLYKAIKAADARLNLSGNYEQHGSALNPNIASRRKRKQFD